MYAKITGMSYSLCTYGQPFPYENVLAHVLFADSAQPRKASHFVGGVWGRVTFEPQQQGGTTIVSLARPSRKKTERVWSARVHRVVTKECKLSVTCIRPARPSHACGPLNWARAHTTRNARKRALTRSLATVRILPYPPAFCPWTHIRVHERECYF